MFLIMILAGIALYVSIAKYLTKIVWRKTQSKAKRYLILWFFILLPFWDVLLGYTVYYPMCWFWAGTEIYGTVQNVDTVFYNIDFPDYGITERNKDPYFKHGNNKAEMNVTKLVAGSVAKEKGLHRFWLDDNGEVKCNKIDKISSSVVITSKREKQKVIPITLCIAYIVNNNELLARKNSLEISYLSLFGGIPFFNWLNWYDQFYFTKYCTDHIDIRSLVINYHIKGEQNDTKH